MQQLKRKTCGKCGRVVDGCYCHLITLLNNDHVPVVILRHTDEVDKPLGTARIASLSLSNCQIIDGVNYSGNTKFQSLIQQKSPRRVVLLYPGLNATPLQPLNLVEISGEVREDDPDVALTLLVVDGTWRNTREILLCNPVLQTLPKVTMSFPVSRYTVRKSPAAECVSTVEALAYALDLLHAGQKSFLSLLDAFDYMVAYQVRRMGQETYTKNYQK